MKLLLALILSFAPLAFAEAPAKCDEEVLRKLFFSDVPGFQDVTDAVNALMLEPDANRVCLERMKSSAALAAELKKGQDFRDSYLGFYAQDFVSENERDLVLTPELKILQNIFAQMELGNRKPGEKPPTPWQVQQWALDAALTRARLGTMSIDKFEKYCKEHMEFQWAWEFYLATYRRLDQNLRVVGPKTSRTVSQFKAMMIDQLNQARVHNLQGAARQALNEWKSHTIQFDDPQSGETHILRVEDLMTMRIQILTSLATNEENAKFGEGLSKARTGVATFLARKWFDYVQAYYKPIEAPPIQGRDTIQLTDADGHAFFISEDDFVNVMQTLGPRVQNDFFGEDAVNLRYRVEASAREEQLVNAIAFLRARGKESFEELYARLKERIDDRIFDQEHATPYLTYEINIAAGLATEPTLQSDVIWSGWRLNPQHWQFREDTAKRLKAPAYNDEYFSPDRKQDPKADQRLRRETRKEERRVAWRYLTENGRRARVAQRVAVRTAKTAAYLAGGLAASWVMYNVYVNYPTIRDFMLNMLPTSSSSAPKPSWDFGGFFKSMLPGGGEGMMSMDQPIEANNYVIPPDQEGDGSGPEKSILDKHDPTHSPFAIEILYRKDAAKMDLTGYYNFANEEHLPKSLRGVHGNDDWFYQNVAVRMHDSGFNRTDFRVYDLAVDVNVRNRDSSAGRVGLLQMEGYEMVGLDLYDWKHTLVPKEAYAVYTISDNRQNFASLKDNYHGPFTFRAYYKYVPSHYLPRELGNGLARDGVLKVSDRLRQSGFKDLADAIPQAYNQRIRERIEVQDLAFQFSSSATYTYDGVKWTQNKNADPAFVSFSQFLNNGHLYYQCTGSNLLFQAFVNEVFKTEGAHSKTALPLVGFHESDRGVPRGAEGHLHSLLVGTGLELYNGYLEADATPAGTRPGSFEVSLRPSRQAKAKAQDNSRAQKKVEEKKEVPVKEEEKKEQTPAKAQPRPKIVDIREDVMGAKAPRIENEPEFEGEYLPAPSAPTVSAQTATAGEPAFVPRNIEEIERILRRVREVRQLAVDAVKPVFLEDTRLNRYDFVEMPGLRVIALSNRMLVAFEHLQQASAALMSLEQTKMSQPAPRLGEYESVHIINGFFQIERTALLKSLDAIRNDSMQGKNNMFDFLAEDPIHSRVSELTELMAVYPWGTLLEQYLAFKATAAHLQNLDCGERLMKRAN